MIISLRLQSLLWVLACLLVFFAVKVVYAQSPEDVAKKHGVTFPILELGGCTSYAACRTYCEDPVNRNQCIDFAKKKGFYKEEKIEIKKQDFWAKTKAVLGCDSESSCRTICEQETNFEKCSNFAKNNGLSGGHTEDPSQGEILQKAKQILGCDSVSSCMNYCSQEANRGKCSEFTKQVGLRGGEEHVGPGGCTSEETCKAFCSAPSNFEVCSHFTSANGGNFSGPGGCNSEESCKAYCQSHPQECKFIGDSSHGGYDPAEMCSKTPNCSWTNNSCQCSSSGGYGDYEKFCRENPAQCQSGTSGSGINPQEYCQKYPDKCSGGSQNYPTYTPYSGSQEQATQCIKTPGCSWTGSTCQCSGTPGSSYSSTPYPTYNTQDAATACTKQSGCSWTGTTCQCASPTSSSSTSTSSNTNTTSSTTNTTSNTTSGGTSSDPATICQQTSGCSWTGSTCQCSSTGVHGATTEKNFLQRIWEFLFGA